MSTRSRKIFKWLLGSLVGLVVVVGLLFGAFGIIVGRVPEYRVQLQDWISERSGLVVEFRSLKARLRLYGPELVFSDAVVRTPDRTRVLATARRGSVAFDLWNSIRTGRLTAGRFTLSAPQIGLIRTREGRIELAGQSALPERPDAEPFAIEQLPTGHFRVTRAVVSFRDEITGRGPWSLSGVSFDLYREPESLRLLGDALLPNALGRTLEFSATVEGALEDSAQLVSTFNVEGSDLDLSGWADVLPDEWPAPETGRGTLKVNGAVHGSQLVQLAAQVDLADVATALPSWTMPLPTALPMQRPANETSEGTEPEATEDTSVPDSGEPAHSAPEVLSYDRVAFDMKAQRRDDAWHLTLSDLDLVRPESAWQSKQIQAEWSRSADGAIRASGEADRIVLENLWPLLAYLPESERVAHLRALDADGTIENLELEYQSDPQAASPRYKLRAHLEGVDFSPVNRLPGVGGLGGDVQATEAGGEWQVAVSSARFELPRMFRDAMVANTVNGKISWQRAESGWKVIGEDLDVRSDDGAGVVRFEVNVPRDGSSPVLDLTAQGHDLRVSATSKYIPAGKLGAKTLQWFDRAFVDGRVVNGELVYRGPIRAFPFRNGEGTFLVRGHVEDATLDYQPPWAPAQDVTADVEFRNQGMHIHATAGVVGNLSVSDALADIADLKQTRLLIKASASGTLQDGLQLLKDSPIGPKLGDRFARLGGSGAIRAQLGLDLPIRNLDARTIDVTARFADATVTMQGIDAPPVKALNGSLTVRNTLLASADLQGQWMDAPLHVTVEPVERDQSVVDARGHASAEQLQKLLGLPPAIRLSGATDWHLAAKLQAGGNDDESQRNTFDIDSRLEGLAIGLPHPIGKNAGDAMPLRASLQFDGDDVLLARASLGDVRSLIRLRRPQQTWELDRGGVRADGIAPALPDHRGLRIEGAVDRFVLDDWLALKGAESGGKPLSAYLQAANVSVGSFELFGYRWPDVRGMLQATPSGWRVDVDGPNAAGQILIPETFTGAQPLRVTLDRLVLDAAQSASEEPQDSGDPRKLPNIQFYAGDLRFGTRSVGAVDLKASRVPQGISFDSATIIGNAVRAEARGKWLVTMDGPQSSLNATISSTDVATTLRAMGYGEVMQAKHGEVRADLSWPGSYNARFLEHASGAISVDAQTGQLVTVQPGAGRVLGLFSVAALPRRLALDFSDLTEKGLAFDTVHGDFELRDGNAYTNNLLLRGPAAEIGIAGRTGLATHDYDQTAIVTGNLGVSVPVAGALAGGPAIGAALLLFTQVFKEPLKGITRGYYRITGPWEDPVVERVDASDIKAEVTRGR